MMWFSGLKTLTSETPFALNASRKMARLSSLTFLPCRVSSCMHEVISPRMAMICPLENGVLWFAMCSARSLSVSTPLYFARA